MTNELFPPEELQIDVTTIIGGRAVNVTVTHIPTGISVGSAAAHASLVRSHLIEKLYGLVQAELERLRREQERGPKTTYTEDEREEIYNLIDKLPGQYFGDWGSWEDTVLRLAEIVNAARGRDSA